MNNNYNSLECKTKEGFKFKLHTYQYNIDIFSIHFITTIGNFDGVHLGHKYLLNELKNEEKPVLIITFSPHPREIIDKNNTFYKILEEQENIKMLLKQNIVGIISFEFNEEFACLNADNFCNILGNNFNIVKIILGYNFNFGKNKQGQADKFLQYQTIYKWKVQNANEYLFNGIKVSSSHIRNLLLKGNITTANMLLNYYYFIKSTVIYGQQIGRQLGFPTANLQINSQVIPKIGVYIAKIKLETSEYFNAVVSIGIRPTFNDEKKISIEVHILNFNKNIYGQHIIVHFISRIRDEKKFSNIDELKQQINTDIKITQIFFNKEVLRYEI